MYGKLYAFKNKQKHNEGRTTDIAQTFVLLGKTSVIISIIIIVSDVHYNINMKLSNLSYLSIFKTDIAFITCSIHSLLFSIQAHLVLLVSDRPDKKKKNLLIILCIVDDGIFKVFYIEKLFS